MTITLPFNTPTANVLRFIIIEYIILKLFSFVTEALANITATNRASNGEKVSFREGWLTFFLVPYRIMERSFLRNLLPWILVVILNAFLLSVEFGFDSQTITSNIVTTTTQQLSTDPLGRSQPLANVPEINWITRVQAITNKCMDRRGNEISAADGFLRDVSINDSEANITKATVVCAMDSRVNTTMNRMMFNVSHSHRTSTRDPFRFATLTVMVDSVADNMYNFAGGDIDMNVRGELHFSPDSHEESKNMFNIFGSCTGFKEISVDGAPVPDFDRTVYCYISDGDKNRFIIPADISDPKFSTLEDVSQGDSFRLIDTGLIIRATILLHDESWKARDGDHLAAIKTLVPAFRLRHNVRFDDIAVKEYYPILARSFYIATVIGATSLRDMPVSMTEDNPPRIERAEVTTWAFAIFCVILVVLVILALCRLCLPSKYSKWNIPVGYNGLVNLVMEDKVVDCEDKKQGLTCGLSYSGQNVQYGVLVSPVDACRKVYDEKLSQDYDVEIIEGDLRVTSYGRY